MTSKELRIGNLILFRKETIIVNWQELKWIQDGLTLGYEYIPLTEDWLLKFGFKLYPSGSYCVDLFGTDNYLAVDVKYNKGFVYINIDDTSLKIELEYVHQLQNLFFSLTNTELNYDKI